MFSEFPVKSLRSGFWTTLLNQCPDDPVIDLTASATHRFTTLSANVKIASCMHFSTVKSALSTAFKNLLSIFFYDLVLTCTVSIVNDSLKIPTIFIGLKF